jgi:molecular chaperone GrpE
MSEEKREEETQHEESETCKTCESWHNKYLHLAADYQNYQKRTEKDRMLWIGQAQQELLLRIIKIVDDFDRAIGQQNQQLNSQDLQAWLEGFEMIGKSLHKLLEQYGVKKITDYSSFDPEWHEAVAQIESPDHQTGMIVEVFEPAYMINETILRPAKVTVAK